jgi:chromosome segregation ATPase
MTDNEIIKALEYFKSYFLRRKTADTDWTTTIGDVLDLINRQKAEIERLREQRDSYMQDATDFSIEVDKQKAEIEGLNEYISRCKSGEEYWVKCLLERPNEAIKELAERLNKEAEKVCIDREGDFVEADGEIYDTVADWCKKTSDNIVNEMAGEDNA